MLISIKRVTPPKMRLVQTHFRDDCECVTGYTLELYIAGRYSRYSFYPGDYFDYDVHESMDELKERSKQYGKRILRQNTERLVKKRGFIYKQDKNYDDEIPF